MTAAVIDRVIGIDLGTTFSVVAHVDAQGRPVTIANTEGDLTTPSVVFLDKAGAIIGKEAVKAAEFEPDRVAMHPKREMGQSWFRHPVRGEMLRPEVLQALILQKLKQDAETRVGPVNKAVITVPAYFNEPRRKATQDAGRMAGLEVIDIINEPTAAAIAYGVQQGFLNPDQPNPKKEIVLVYDLGGGTFDVTLMEISQNCFVVLATAGDVELGGIDWDNRIVDFVATEFMQQHSIDPREDPAARYRLHAEAEDAKRSLSTRMEVQIAFAHEGKRLRLPLTRARFEMLTGDLVDRTELTVKRLLREAKLQYSDLTRVLVVGGSSRMPMIAEMLERETGFKVDRSLSMDEAVAQGAAIYGQSLLNSANAGHIPLRVKNVNSHDLGVLGISPSTGMNRRQLMIARNTPLPTEKTHTFVTFRESQRSVSVPVVEGGDASGNNSTLIGKCVVSRLMIGLPARTPIEVTFRYLDNGRLEVRAFLPTIGRDAILTIERATGMPDDQLAAWTQAVQLGLPDGYARPFDESSKDSSAAPSATEATAPQAVPTAPVAKPVVPVAQPVVAVAQPVATVAASPIAAVVAQPVTVANGLPIAVAVPVAAVLAEWPSIEPSFPAEAVPSGETAESVEADSFDFFGESTSSSTGAEVEETADLTAQFTSEETVIESVTPDSEPSPVDFFASEEAVNDEPLAESEPVESGAEPNPLDFFDEFVK